MKVSFMKSMLTVLLSALAWSCMDHQVPAGPTLEQSWTNGWDSQKVLAIPKGLRPDPSAYLQASYITYQLMLFKNGASYLVTKKITGRLRSGSVRLSRQYAIRDGQTGNGRDVAENG